MPPDRVDAGMLAPYRVLDLTDAKGQPCGKLLADLGADVIKVEPPEGDPARRRGPFVDDVPGPDRGLYWLTYNANKRSYAVDLETEAGRERFRRLVATVDIVIESFRPGWMGGVGLDYARLAAINPGLVLVSISAFGQEGPHRDYQAPDIVAWAMGGPMSICGEVDGPPAQISDNNQSFLAASCDAASGALLALLQRELTGRGQQVDVSIQEAVIRSAFQVTPSWDMMGCRLPRETRPAPSDLRWLWRCLDGWVMWMPYLGPRTSVRSAGFFDWLRATGAGADLLSLDWEAMNPSGLTREDLAPIEQSTARVFANHTKAELYEAAASFEFTLYPVATAAETLASPQLRARGFWEDLPHPALGRSLPLPGAFARATRTPPSLRSAAPRIGEHTAAVDAELDGASTSATASASVVAAPEVCSRAVDRAPPPPPLAGVKVLDFSWFMVGPMTIKVLADYGADVVHIESSTRVDAQRTAGPFRDGIRDPELSGDYGQVRTSQRSIMLNIAQPQGRDTALRMAAWADVVVDNFAPGVMDRLGLGEQALRAVNPELIILSCSGQGQSGPRRGSKGGGGHYAALAGFNELTGWPDREPGYISTYTDFIAPRFSVPLILGALDYRRRTGLGQSFEVSQYEAAVHWLAPSVLDYAVNGRVAQRLGNRQPDAAPHGAYRCRDGRWCVIAVTNAEEWDAFRQAIGEPAWTQESRFETHAGRKQHEDALDALVEQWTRQRTPAKVMNTLQWAGVPAGVVQGGEELLELDPQLQARGFWHALDHPTLGRYHAPQHAFQLSDTPCVVRRSRLIGEDTAEILRDVLRLSGAEIGDLAAAGVLQ